MAKEKEKTKKAKEEEYEETEEESTEEESTEEEGEEEAEEEAEAAEEESSEEEGDDFRKRAKKGAKAKGGKKARAEKPAKVKKVKRVSREDWEAPWRPSSVLAEAFNLAQRKEGATIKELEALAKKNDAQPAYVLRFMRLQRVYRGWSWKVSDDGKKLRITGAHQGKKAA